MISIVLMEPETAGNVGAIARVMKNFDLKDLYVIDPKCDIQGDEAHNRAKHAQDILNNIKTIKKSDLKRFNTVIATTSQLGTDYNIPRTPITPDQLTSILPKTKENLAILFGREGIGLTNEEVEEADFILSIPASKKYPTLNLSHSVAIVLYELFKSKLISSTSHITILSRPEREQMEKMLDSILDNLHFATKQKKETQKRVWKKIFARSFISRREAYAVMGLLRKLSGDKSEKD